MSSSDPYRTSTSTTSQAPDSGRHPVNTGHLVMGIAFLGIAAIWAVMTGDVVDADNLRWLLPVPWLVAGAVGLTAVALGSRRRSGRTEDTDPIDDLRLDDTPDAEAR